ncbi:DNA repair protein RecN [Clostridium sp. 'deep sea']|uniref:DNA repair protein RecN n=1 Tax=Clostridium sp. 'deep sea' TaxID=2779445 RepID=UPI0018968ADC|nr:DNA repair protein RecN [Clostridium sp. 'deep sea']QOR35841.1 DNA repair protein RecN [Clostridium sp. 'deep sea']
MLIGLSLKNFALVENANIDFFNNLNILTGETGAGKSILIDAVGLALGGRSSVTFIRSGANKCKITATFKIENIKALEEKLELFGIDYEDNILIVDREISRNGRNKNLINGIPVTLNMLKQIGNYLINIYGQHEHTKLLQEQYQRLLIDTWGFDKISKIKNDISKILQKIAVENNKLQEFGADDTIVARELDILRYQYEEIENANLEINEDIDLERESTLLRSVEKINSVLGEVESVFFNDSSQISLIDNIGNCASKLAQFSSIDDSIKNIYEMISSIYYNTQELSGEISSYLNQLDFNPQRLDFIEERLNDINNLKRKYGDSINKILEYATKVDDKIYKLENSTEERNIIIKNIHKLKTDYFVLAKKLSNVRTRVANDFCKKIQKDISDLGMQYAKIACQVNYNDNLITKEGSDQVKLLFSANKGEPLNELSEVISGGELSRLMLVIKALITNENDVSAIIFDEIDVGIGGQVAKAVADKLYDLANNLQVLCVTHLPVIAAKGNHHFKIEKNIKNNRTITKIEKIEDKARVIEIMRMLGSDETDKVTREHAFKLLNN